MQNSSNNQVSQISTQKANKFVQIRHTYQEIHQKEAEKTRELPGELELETLFDHSASFEEQIGPCLAAEIHTENEIRKEKRRDF